MFDSLGKSAEIWTGCFKNHYAWPTDLIYDDYVKDSSPVINNTVLATFNADSKAEKLYEYT